MDMAHLLTERNGPGRAALTAPSGRQACGGWYKRSLAAHRRRRWTAGLEQTTRCLQSAARPPRGPTPASTARSWSMAPPTCTAPSTRCRRSAIRAASPPAPSTACSTCCRSCSASIRAASVIVVFDAPGQDLPRRTVRRVQGPPPAHARRPARAGRAAAAGRARAMGLPLLRLPGVEADDVIGTLARAGRGGGPAGADLHRRQGHGAAGRRTHHADQHHDRHLARPRRREGQVRRAGRSRSSTTSR